MHADAPPFSTGTVLEGKFRVIRLLGQGGMGVVYEVEHVLTKHHRALKLLHREVAQNPEMVERFQREASAAGRIDNPHIVETFDAGMLESGEPYLAMEMLKGEPLSSVLGRDGRIRMAELAEIGNQAAGAIQAAHDVGIVHRDLKPDNLFLHRSDKGPFVKILDFGISKFAPELTEGEMALTGFGALLGTPYYMSPEQLQGLKDVDGRTDIYALGVILYECIAGQRPFQAKSFPALALAVQSGTFTPLSEVCSDVPNGFLSIVERAMARERDERFKTARDLGSALAPFASRAATSGGDGLQIAATKLIPGQASSPPPVDNSLALAATQLAEESALPTATRSPRKSPWLWIGALVGVGAIAGTGAMAARSTPWESATPDEAVAIPNVGGGSAGDQSGVAGNPDGPPGQGEWPTVPDGGSPDMTDAATDKATSEPRTAPLPKPTNKPVPRASDEDGVVRQNPYE